MKEARRKRIRAVIKHLQSGNIDWDDIECELSDIKDEEEDARDSMPESFCDTENYQIMEESIELLEEAIDYIDPDDECSAAEIIRTLKLIDKI